MSVDVFNNPFNGKPVVWNAQGALITWATLDQGLSQIFGLLSRLSSNYNPDLDAAGIDTGNKARSSHAFACLTGLQIQYGRQSSTQYPIGGYNPIRILGAPSGICQITSLLGPNTELSDFLKASASACNLLIIGIKPFANQAACENAVNGNNVIILLKGCSINQLNINIQPQGQGISLINVPINVEFTNLVWDAGTK